jgi:hypothetical protein
VKYTEPKSITRNEVASALASQDPDIAATALIRMSLSESDWEWAEHTCLLALKNDETKIKVAALSAIGNLGRRFHTLHLDIVLAAINKLREQKVLIEIADDTLEDIAMFVTNDTHHG